MSVKTTDMYDGNVRGQGISQGGAYGPVSYAMLGGSLAYIQIDADACAPAADACAANATRLLTDHRAAMSDMLDHYEHPIDRTLGVALIGISNHLQKTYLSDANNLASMAARENAYRDNPVLSEQLDKKHVACVEMSLLASMALERLGYECEVVSGVVYHSDEQEFGEGHTYVIIKQGDKRVIYDANNHTAFAGTSNVAPRAYVVDEAVYTEWQTRGAYEPCMMQLTDPITKNTALYGVNGYESSRFDWDTVGYVGPIPPNALVRRQMLQAGHAAKNEGLA